MNISIMNIRPATADEWDALWQQCDYATYFQSREWADIWNIYTKGEIRPEPKLVLFSDGNKALLSLSSRRFFKGLTKQYLFSPAGTFGGWISGDRLDSNHAQLLTNYLCEKLGGNLVWRLNPYDKLVQQVKIEQKKEDYTYALDISNGFEAVYEKWSKGGWKKGSSSASRTAAKARKAERDGVSIRVAKAKEDWEEYYQVYQDSLQRWGNAATSKYEWELFDSMYQMNSPNIKLWLGIYENKIIVGEICFYATNHAVTWHGAALRDFFKLHGRNLLIYELVKDASERGYSWFDFNPSGGHEGVAAFKKSFGAEALPCPTVNTKDSITAFLKVVNSKFK